VSQQKPLTPFFSTDPRVAPAPTAQPVEDEPQTFPATFTVHMPSGSTYACEHHAETIVAVAQFMGSTAMLSDAPAGAQCANCIQEAKW
jgi:hypothetical protein